MFLYSYVGITILKQTSGPSLLPCCSDSEQMFRGKVYSHQPKSNNTPNGATLYQEHHIFYPKLTYFDFMLGGPLKRPHLK